MTRVYCKTDRNAVKCESQIVRCDRDRGVAMDDNRCGFEHALVVIERETQGSKERRAVAQARIELHRKGNIEPIDGDVSEGYFAVERAP